MEVTRHDHGAFSWAELATTDTAAAKKFYAALFGWAILDSPMGPGPEDVYTRLQLSGKDVGALYPMRPEQRQQGVPPNWLTYVTVKSADDAAKKAKTLGGTVIAEPFDVMTFGRMAMIQDPSGAIFAIWQAGDHIGAERVNEPGAFCWMELVTPDVAKAKAFYTGLFGWGLKESTDPAMPYTEVQLADRSIGGMYPPMSGMGNVPPHWGVYWQVADTDASAARAKSLGGNLCVEPKDISKVGRFAVIQDPQGAAFSIIKLAAA
jgi:predicted enzyme related to lactoylglutathione lyase